jgi:hypothetical protein
VRTPIDDIGELEFKDADDKTILSASRTIEGWRRVEDDGLTLPTPQEQAAIDDTLSMLTAVNAKPILADDATLLPALAIEVRGLTGTPIGTFTFGLAPAGESQSQPVITADRIAYLYPPDSAKDILAWLGK